MPLSCQTMYNIFILCTLYTYHPNGKLTNYICIKDDNFYFTKIIIKIKKEHFKWITTLNMYMIRINGKTLLKALYANYVFCCNVYL